jgi:hypothetical protein
MRNNKKNFIKQINKRFQTTIIGAIARMEDSFGYLWGHNSDKELTDKQEEFLNLWEATRTSILNHGNHQMRNTVDDIIDFLDAEQEYYRYNFIIKNKENRS